MCKVIYDYFWGLVAFIICYLWKLSKGVSGSPTEFKLRQTSALILLRIVRNTSTE